MQNVVDSVWESVGDTVRECNTQTNNDDIYLTILESEADAVQALEALVTLFLLPFRAHVSRLNRSVPGKPEVPLLNLSPRDPSSTSKPPRSSNTQYSMLLQEIDDMFPCLEDLNEIHSQMILPAIHASMASTSPIPFAHAILLCKDRLQDAYHFHISNFEDSFNAMAEFCERLACLPDTDDGIEPALCDVWSFVMQNASSSELASGYSLPLLMIAPIKQLVRYQMWLQTSISETNDDLVHRAFLVIDEICEGIDNAFQRSHETRHGRVVQDRLNQAYGFGYAHSNRFELTKRKFVARCTFMAPATNTTVEFSLFDNTALLIVCIAAYTTNERPVILALPPSDAHVLMQHAPSPSSTTDPSLLMRLVISREKLDMFVECASPQMRDEWCELLWASGARGSTSRQPTSKTSVPVMSPKRPPRFPVNQGTMSPHQSKLSRMGSSSSNHSVKGIAAPPVSPLLAQKYEDGDSDFEAQASDSATDTDTGSVHTCSSTPHYHQNITTATTATTATTTAATNALRANLRLPGATTSHSSLSPHQPSSQHPLAQEIVSFDDEDDDENDFDNNNNNNNENGSYPGDRRSKRKSWKHQDTFDSNPNYSDFDASQKYANNNDWSDNDLASPATASVPAGKQRQIENTARIEREVEMSLTEDSDGEDAKFEKVLDVLRIPLHQRPQMRAWDTTKKNLLAKQANMLPENNSPGCSDVETPTVPRWTKQHAQQQQQHMQQVKQMEQETQQRLDYATTNTTSNDCDDGDDGDDGDDDDGNFNNGLNVSSEMRDSVDTEAYDNALDVLCVPENQKRDMLALNSAQKRLLVAEASKLTKSISIANDDDNDDDDNNDVADDGNDDTDTKNSNSAITTTTKTNNITATAPTTTTTTTPTKPTVANRHSAKHTNDVDDDLDVPAVAIPAWKKRQMEQAARIDREMSAAKQDSLSQQQQPLQSQQPPQQKYQQQVNMDEFEATLDALKIPEKQRPQIRALDAKQKTLLMEQAKKLPKTTPTMPALGSGGGAGATVESSVFEAVLDELKIPHAQRPHMRRLDNDKKRLLIEKAELARNKSAKKKNSTPKGPTRRPSGFSITKTALTRLLSISSIISSPSTRRRSSNPNNNPNNNNTNTITNNNHPAVAPKIVFVSPQNDTPKRNSGGSAHNNNINNNNNINRHSGGSSKHLSHRNSGGFKNSPGNRNSGGSSKNSARNRNSGGSTRNRNSGTRNSYHGSHHSSKTPLSPTNPLSPQLTPTLPSDRDYPSSVGLRSSKSNLTQLTCLLAESLDEHQQQKQKLRNCNAENPQWTDSVGTMCSTASTMLSKTPPTANISPNIPQQTCSAPQSTTLTRQGTKSFSFLSARERSSMQIELDQMKRRREELRQKREERQSLEKRRFEQGIAAESPE